MTNKFINGLLMLIVINAACAATVRAELGWQEQMLFEPSPQQLEPEARGRVMIYNGLKDIRIEEALDQQFDRIEHMMFTGTIITDENGTPRKDAVTGEVLVEDDGC